MALPEVMTDSFGQRQTGHDPVSLPIETGVPAEVGVPGLLDPDRPSSSVRCLWSLPVGRYPGGGSSRGRQRDGRLPSRRGSADHL